MEMMEFGIINIFENLCIFDIKLKKIKLKKY